MDSSMPGLPVPHHLPGVCQVHVHCISDAVQPSHPLMPSSSSASIFPSIRDFSNQSSVSSDDQNTGASASVLPVNIQGLSPLRLTGLIFVLSKRLSGVFSSTTVQRHKFFGVPSPLWSSSHGTLCDHWEDHTLDYTDLFHLLFSTLSRFVIAFLPRSNHLLISWLQSQSAVILEPKKRKSVSTFTFSPSICHEVMGPVVMILVFFNI